MTPPAAARADPGYRFADELPPAGRYQVGSLAMANAGPNTNGSQFFVISGPDGVRLPPLYSLFGDAVAGLDVIERIDAVGSRSGKPTDQVVIETRDHRGEGIGRGRAASALEASALEASALESSQAVGQGPAHEHGG